MPGVEPGRLAPDFELPDQHRERWRLSSFRSRKTVLIVFYPFAFTPTCTGEVGAIRDELADFANDDVQVLAISCDPTAALRVFAEQQRVEYPLLSDFWPHGEVSRAYGVFEADRGFAMRGSFIVDRDGVLRWMVVNHSGEARDIAEYRKALAEVLGR